MSKAERLKKAHIKKVNELLDKGHRDNSVKEEPIVLKPSDNVTTTSKEFINKMGLLECINKIA